MSLARKVLGRLHSGTLWTEELEGMLEGGRMLIKTSFKVVNPREL